MTHSPHTSSELVHAQLRALEAWNAARARAEHARSVATVTREVRMDLARRMDVLREQHRAIVARTDDQLRESVRLMTRRPPLRAVVAHRNGWFTDRLCGALLDDGVEVVARTTNGAEAVGVVVAEQPDMLLVEDVLSMLTAVDVVREVRGYAPSTVIGAHVAAPQRVGALLEAGAHGAWARTVPPADVSRGLVQLLEQSMQHS